MPLAGVKIRILKFLHLSKDKAEKGRSRKLVRKLKAFYQSILSVR